MIRRIHEMDFTELQKYGCTKVTIGDLYEVLNYFEEKSMAEFYAAVKKCASPYHKDYKSIISRADRCETRIETFKSMDLRDAKYDREMLSLFAQLCDYCCFNMTYIDTFGERLKIEYYDNGKKDAWVYEIEGEEEMLYMGVEDDCDKLPISDGKERYMEHFGSESDRLMVYCRIEMMLRALEMLKY